MRDAREARSDSTEGMNTFLRRFEALTGNRTEVRAWGRACPTWRAAEFGRDRPSLLRATLAHAFRALLRAAR